MKTPVELALPGLRTDPYAGYLGGLGVLRLVAEQRDPQALGWWRNGHFWLRSSLGQAELVRFLVQEYAPTPIVSPWNKNGGYLRRFAEHPRYAIESSSDVRFQPYRSRLERVAAVLAEAGKEVEKKALLRKLRSLWPEDRWLDSVVDWGRRTFSFSALALAGGMDGKMEFATMFMEALRWLLLAERRPEGRAEELLRALLFEEPTDLLVGDTQGLFDPATARSHAGSDWGEATPLSNPWGLVLALEGLVSGVVRVEPHRPTRTGGMTADEARHDLVAALWSEPRSIEQAREAVEQQRFALAQRSGKSYFSIRTAWKPSRFDLGALGPWLQRERPEFARWRRSIEPLAPQPDATAVLERIGRLRLHGTEAPWLGQSWDKSGDDGSAEFDLALSLASLGCGLHRHLRLRPQMGQMRGRDLCERMVALARFRVWSGQRVSKMPNRAGIVRFNDPFWSSHTPRPHHLLLFLRGEVEERRLEDLLHALCLVDRFALTPPAEADFAGLPGSYLFLKRVFCQQKGDRRPASLAALEALYCGQAAQALKLAGDYLARRGERPVELEFEGISARRMAAAMLFPLPGGRQPARGVGPVGEN